MRTLIKPITGLAMIFVALILLGNASQITDVFANSHSLDGYLTFVQVAIFGAGVPIAFIVSLVLKIRKERMKRQ